MAFMALFLLLLFFEYANLASPPKDVVSKLGFITGKKMVECVRTHYPNYGYEDEIGHFWDTRYPLVDENLGCAFLCAFYKMNMLFENGTLNEDHFRHFLTFEANADIKTTVNLIEVVRNCHQSIIEFEKICAVGFATLLCLRRVLNKPEWRPDAHAL